MPRAEHKAIFAGTLGYMYMFGGVTQLGLMNDFYTFDPTTLMWEEGKMKRGFFLFFMLFDKFNFFFKFFFLQLLLIC